MTRRLLGRGEQGSHLTPEAIIERARAYFPTVTVGKPHQGAPKTRRERDWLLDRLLGPKLADDAMDRLRGAIPFTVADEYGEPSLRCYAVPGRPLEVVLVDEWLEWPGGIVRDQEGAEQLFQQLGEVLGYSLIPEQSQAEPDAAADGGGHVGF